MLRFLRGFSRLTTHPEIDVNRLRFFLRSAFYHLRAKRIYAAGNTVIRGISNIVIDGELTVGLWHMGWLTERDYTLLNIKGTLTVQGSVHLAKGCRLDICRNATCTLQDCTVTGPSTFIIAHHLSVGAQTAISWGCEFLDQDWHTIEYPGRQEPSYGITIGDHVWIGSHVKILKGVQIANNCVVAANTVVTKPFLEEHALIAGNPARIIRRGVEWQ